MVENLVNLSNLFIAFSIKKKELCHFAVDLVQHNCWIWLRLSSYDISPSNFFKHFEYRVKLETKYIFLDGERKL